MNGKKKVLIVNFHFLTLKCVSSRKVKPTPICVKQSHTQISTGIVYCTHTVTEENTYAGQYTHTFTVYGAGKVVLSQAV